MLAGRYSAGRDEKPQVSDAKTLRLVDHAFQQKRRSVDGFKKVEHCHGIAGRHSHCVIDTVFDVDDADRRGRDRHSLGQVFAGRVGRAQGHFMDFDRRKRRRIAK